MPIYAYHCQNCGADAEYIQKFSDPPMTVCEQCNGTLERAVTAAAFHLKGGGWYKDGYGSAGSAGRTENQRIDTLSQKLNESESKSSDSSSGSSSSGDSST